MVKFLVSSLGFAGIISLVGWLAFKTYGDTGSAKAQYTFTATDGESVVCTVTKGNKREMREWKFTNKTVSAARECVGRITESPEIAAFVRAKWDECMESAP